MKRRVRNFQQILRRQTVKHEKQLKGQLPNQFKQTRSTQTPKQIPNKRALDSAGDESLETRYKDIRSKLSLANGKYGNAVREIAKLQKTLKSQEEKHDNAVTKLKDKIAALEARLQKKEVRHLDRQLHSRGKDSSTYAGFIQYMAEPSQEY